MLEYNQILKGKFIVMDGQPYEVVDAHVFRKQQRKPVNQTKLKNVITGKVTERSFGASEKAEEADIEKKNIKFIYENRGEYWFTEENDPSKRFSLPGDLMGNKSQFMKADSLVEAQIFNDEIIGISLPIKMVFEVKEAPPAVRGNTAQGGNKVVTLETGATVTAPLFINPGDKIRVNTETGEYVERANE